MLRKNRAILISVLFIPMLLISAWIAYSAACDYERQTEVLTDRLHTQPKVTTLLKRFAEGITLGKLYKGYSQELEELEAIKVAKENYKSRADRATIVFFLLSGVFFASIYVLTVDKSFLISAMLIVSLIALAVGLFAPILMIVNYKEVPILGEVVFRFQSKGIVTTIETLFTSGNILVAIPLFLFSIMIPFLKTVIMGLALFTPAQSIASYSLRFIRTIGKWSMADVFVVALLLTFFIVNKDKSTNAAVQTGLYFFLCYVILSMIASHLLIHAKALR
jgi:paraquat-inducible protein A